jgi:serine/threonine protein phosphatase PrpC
VSAVADDALERRIARFVAEEKAPCSLNGTSDVCLGTCIGVVREQNQDRGLITFTSYPAAPEKDFALGVVCDGMGGLISGNEAAVIAVSVFVSRVIRWPSQPARDRLRWAAMAANEAVHKALGGLGGTTLSAVMVGRQAAVVGVNAGDSRIYGLTRSREVKQLSRDDTVGGLLGPREGMGADRLIQYIGMGDGIQPRIIEINREEFECVLITSDGVHCASPATFAQAVGAPTSNLDLIRRLLALSDALGGQDNGTALLLPTRFEVPNGDSEQGLNLTFWSPSDRLEIWIPAL